MNRTNSERAVILAPRGRDAEIAKAMLREAGIDSDIAASLPDFIERLRRGAGFGIVTDETLRGADLRGLDAFLKAQEEWSDFPFVLLTERGGSIERNPAAGRYLDLLGNVTFIERPFHPTTLISIARAALRGRRRQYEARARLREIRDAEQQLRIALAAGKLGAWSFDAASMRLDASSDCKGHFGRAAGDSFTYEELVACVHEEDRAMMQAEVRHALATGEDYDVEYRCVWPDASLHWVQVRGRPALDAAGRALAMTGVSQDITERKVAEEKLRDFTVELERRVEERTREYADAMAQLHEAQKLETLGRLTGGVAHDFNNLLTPIVGSLDLVRRKITDERLQKLVDGALQSSERARTLVARLLAFARRQNLETLPVDVTQLVAGTAELIQRSLGPTIALELDLPGTVPPAMVDPHQLELALLNLAINARDAMPGGGRLSIVVAHESIGSGDPFLNEGSYVRVAVTDSGAGMDAATLARAVEPFYSTKGVGKGTGLGLSMVHGLAAQSGGQLTLYSEPGEGTTAEIWLPAATSAAVTHKPRFDPAMVEAPPMRILLVDDEDSVRASTAAMLEDMGHRVIPADNGQAALRAIRSQPFDIVVTDYLMPGMSGLELAAEARKVRADMPILMITGFADLAADTATHVIRLSKPFRAAELARAIRDVALVNSCPS
ncbi:response regulator [Sphingopyxis chilensis]|uniref:response regulator n=1 Tax=Sphingopyxis chilensis TaxID=180400 RepID=UPI002DDC9530|nr:response regulator [Sphingopyxis chilensis]